MRQADASGAVSGRGVVAGGGGRAAEAVPDALSERGTVTGMADEFSSAELLRVVAWLSGGHPEVNWLPLGEGRRFELALEEGSSPGELIFSVIEFELCPSCGSRFGDAEDGECSSCDECPEDSYGLETVAQGTLLHCLREHKRLAQVPPPSPEWWGEQYPAKLDLYPPKADK